MGSNEGIAMSFSTQNFLQTKLWLWKAFGGSVVSSRVPYLNNQNYVWE